MTDQSEPRNEEKYLAEPALREGEKRSFKLPGVAQIAIDDAAVVEGVAKADQLNVTARRAGNARLLVLLKNCENVLLVLVVFQLMLLAAEMCAALVLVRRWSFIKNSYIEAVRDLFRLAPHIHEERRRLGRLRQRGDFYMLRFFRVRMNRWDEVAQMMRAGPPKVSPK